MRVIRIYAWRIPDLHIALINNFTERNYNNG